MPAVFALADCNNFYASCECLFQPEYRDYAVVVLSNNDGCVIARNEKAKAIGIKMGTPVFEVQELIKKYNVAVFSSNYTLYGDMSMRVMRTLETFAPDVEVYSIYEAFLDLRRMACIPDMTAYATEIRATVQQHTGITVGVGVAPTKTLAKAANRYAKKVHRDKGVFVIDSEAKREEVLRWLPVRDVWGIGSKHGHRMEHYGVCTAWDFTQLNEQFIKHGDPNDLIDHGRKKFFAGMGVVGQRLYHELRGVACRDIDVPLRLKKNICTSRSFPSDLSDKNEIRKAIANHVVRCSEKLRYENCAAGNIMVFLLTNPFKNRAQYSPALPIKLLSPTNNTTTLLEYAMKAFERIFRPGYGYKKAGVIVTEIVAANEIQHTLFAVRNTPKENKLSAAMDAINNALGRDKVRMASQGYGGEWRLRCEHLSQQYTTNVEQLLHVKV